MSNITGISRFARNDILKELNLAGVRWADIWVCPYVLLLRRQYQELNGLPPFKS